MNLREFYKMPISTDSIARAIAYAIEQPAEVEMDEVVFRPTVQDFQHRAQRTHRDDQGTREHCEHRCTSPHKPSQTQASFQFAPLDLLLTDLVHGSFCDARIISIAGPERNVSWNTRLFIAPYR
jgi:hypothetical protein